MKNLALILLLIPTILKSQSPLETEFLKQLNSYRDSLGLSKLEYDSNLSIAAKHLVDYKIKVYEKFGKAAFDTTRHKELLDLPEFKEIVTPSERVENLTNFKYGAEITGGCPSTITFLEKLNKSILEAKNNPKIKVTYSKDLIIGLDSISRSYSLLRSFKRSYYHNRIIIRNWDNDVKIGICENKGVIVAVFGSPKNK
jgi:hypothetical protein